MYIEIVSLNTKLSYCCVPVIFPCSILKSLVFWNILFFCVTNPDVPDLVIVWHEQGFRFRCSLSIVNYVNGRLRLSIAILVKKYWRWENIFMSSFLWTSPPASESFTPPPLLNVLNLQESIFPNFQFHIFQSSSSIPPSPAGPDTWPSVDQLQSSISFLPGSHTSHRCSHQYIHRLLSSNSFLQPTKIQIVNM